VAARKRTTRILGTTLGRKVAVKVMLPKISSDADMAKRFRREARTLATLQHENIISVYDLVEKNRQVFMILEFVDGPDVSELLRGGARLPLEVALIIGVGIARALEHAHFRRVIHRDIKPSNVMISRRGEVKLGDFGIAKEVGDRDLTATGFVVGTPSYLPPELLKGERADLRGDFYALGIVLFECLTGQRPFRGESPKELVAAILAGQRDKVRALAPDCPRAVEKIIDTCLESIDRRYQRAADLRKDLEAQLREANVTNPAARLVAFLYSRNLARVEDLATIDVGELKAADPTIDISTGEIEALSKHVDDLLDVPIEVPKPAPRWGRRFLAAAVLLVMTAGGVTYAFGPARTLAAVRTMLHAP
jgi:serine/threonine-protein kinase